MSDHTIPVRTNLIVFASLLALLAATVGMAFVDLDIQIQGRSGPIDVPLNFPLAMAIAATKAVLIMLYFMHLRYSARLTWVAAGASFLWLGILLVLSLSDYLSRGWLEVVGK